MKNGMLQENSRKKLVFIHVAKSGGTSIKSFLKGNFSEGHYEAELENNLEWDRYENLDWFAQMRFLSGHMAYAEFEKRIDLSHFLVVTCIRDPLEHIRSHIVHFRRMAERDSRAEFEASSAETQGLILKLAKLDLSSPAAITSLYHSMSDLELLLFDNCQVRYFTRGLSQKADGRRVGFNEMSSALKTLKEIDLVGTTDRIQRFLEAISDNMGWDSPLHIPRENCHNERYGIDIRDPAIVNALWPFVRFDYALYSQRGSFYCCL